MEKKLVRKNTLISKVKVSLNTYYTFNLKLFVEFYYQMETYAS